MEEGETQIRWAREADAAAVVAVWSEVSSWLESIAQPLWASGDFDVASTEAAARNRELVVEVAGSELAACMRLTSSDPTFWPSEAHDSAVYVHKLAVARAYAGEGWTQSMLNWAAEYARLSGAQALRLDCDLRDKLVQLYSRCGFLAFDPEPITCGGYSVLRFERRIRLP